NDDVIYLDAGTTTEAMIDYIQSDRITYICKCYKAYFIKFWFIC
ncbi:Lactose phosphotransferase system repressor, partial [human gut metagenome]